MKRTTIPPELRPSVAGSSIVEKDDVIRQASRMASQFKICIIGSSRDPVIRYVMRTLTRESLPFAFIDLERKTAVVNGIHQIKELIRREVTKISIFIRPFEYQDSESRAMCGILYELVDLYSGSVINRPSRSISNGAKPLHYVTLMRELKSFGGDVSSAQTQILTSHTEIDGSCHIVKSISAVRSQVVVAGSLSSADTQRSTADSIIMVQELLQGINYRVHTFGASCVSLLVKSSCIDYRSDPNVRFEQIRLPAHVDRACIAAAQTEGLEFAGVDLIQSLDGRWVILEANPAPAYHFFESRLASKPNLRPLSKALIRLLLGIPVGSWRSGHCPASAPMGPNWRFE
jgi:hypothetical protein